MEGINRFVWDRLYPPRLPWLVPSLLFLLVSPRPSVFPAGLLVLLPEMPAHAFWQVLPPGLPSLALQQLPAGPPDSKAPSTPAAPSGHC